MKKPKVSKVCTKDNATLIREYMERGGQITKVPAFSALPIPEQTVV